ncbi:MAG TPA: lysophospholipid acyltransferase family protein [Thiobacillaceae bacterium]|nr:lysophospholipid acyltransferase family protein [Thiobacillaceae bacterium]HNU63440.1 lysophospholipid acyltransferase family protein [Thiobacillaceae bacterium]
MALARSLLFTLLQGLLTLPFGLAAPFLLPLPRLARYRIITLWGKGVIFLARRVLGIRHRVVGLEHLPRTPAVVLAKHQSAWETIAFQQIFPPLSFVLKKNLLHIPFFGWGLALFSPIAIDRGAGREALKQIEVQGRERLQQGFCVLVFPEGTRVAPGETGNYQIGGAWLAVKAGVPVLPVAHNAGRCWPKNALIKRPGEITVIIGPAIPTAGRKATEVLAETRAWIETAMADL